MDPAPGGAAGRPSRESRSRTRASRSPSTTGSAREKEQARARDPRRRRARWATVRLIGGKQVVNILPAGAPHKGLALERARARLGCDTAVYVGDDETDEDVFALDRPGRLLGIRVGRKRSSSAASYVRAQAEIDRLLRAAPGLPAGGLTLEAGSLPPPGETLEFMRLLWAIDHGLQRRSKRMAKTLGLTGPQRLVVRMLGRYPGISAGQLAQVLHLHPSTLTGILRRLERRGWLTRRRRPPGWSPRRPRALRGRATPRRGELRDDRGRDESRHWGGCPRRRSRRRARCCEPWPTELEPPPPPRRPRARRR